jgi:O-antigen/teichoic acid export membrane protein
VINIPLILKYGVYGAMIATLLSELTVTSYQLIKVRTALKLSKLFANVGKYMFAAVIMFMPVYVLNICMKISAISLFF